MKHRTRSSWKHWLAIAALCTVNARAIAQESHVQPEWWFGGAAGANINFYSGEIKTLNAGVPAPGPTTFSKGSGSGLYLAPLIEYRPDPKWGGMLQFGFDGRNGSFDDIADSGTTYSLQTAVNYLSLEPSVRFSPDGSGFHFIAGPRIGFNVAKSFTLDPHGAAKTEGEWSSIRGTVLSAQIGAGYDIPLSPPDAEWQTLLTPFASIQFGQGPRSVESWSLTSFRGGVALKFGNSAQARERAEGELALAVRAPRIIPLQRKVKETFPMRNYIFFDEGSGSVPARYTRLSRDEASRFREENLVQPEPKDLTGRSRRQMTVYHHILNVIGDRMRRNPDASVSLSGSSEKGAAEGRVLAEAVKSYLVDVFGIEAGRISAEGREKPAIPSFQPGGTRELEFVRPEDRRVEVSSSSPRLLEPVQIISLQDEPLDSDVLVTLSGAEDLLASWTAEVSDNAGGRRSFGPFTSSQERIPGGVLLGDKMQGTYTITVTGRTRDGQTIRKEDTFRLVKSDLPEDEPGLRFSILFEFDQSKTVATYDRFLSGTVAPLIPDGGSVIIHGHTDIVGEESHNLRLSRDRAEETMRIFQRELARSGKKRVKFDTYGFGEDARRAPFENRYPEERFYNRTVVIDIVPE